MMMRSA